MRVFGKVLRRYYRLKQPEIRFDAVLSRLDGHAGLGGAISAQQFESACQELKDAAKDDASLSGLFNGVHVPFVCPQTNQEADLGKEFEEHWLAAVQRSFVKSNPQHHFKRNLQGASPTLSEALRVAEGSRYENLLRARKEGAVVGWYFPTALQEYDIASQRAQMRSLPLPETLVLSGGLDAAAALVGSPDLLMNTETYPPVLCLSGFAHKDPRLMLCFKAYGLSLEFWLLGQMLVPGVTQVSEQWTGGLTMFTVIQ
jgi:hypothetical protein